MHPEEIRILIQVCACDGSVGEDDFHVDDMIERETPHTCERPFASNRRMTAYADLGTRPMSNCPSTLVFQLLCDSTEPRTAADRCIPCMLIDPDMREMGQVDDERTGSPAKGV